SLRSQYNLFSNTGTFTQNIVALNNVSGNMTKTENLVAIDIYDNIFSPTSFTETTSGRIFDKIAGYLDVSSPSPFHYASLSQPFPDGGVTLMSGAGNAAIRVTASSPEVVVISLDLDGDGAFETSTTLKWTNLSGPLGADLADTDGDGMHNSWETAKGFDPNNAADALQDKDGDGASNLAEYLAGTDPNNATSAPPAVGLAIAATDSPDPVGVGALLTYQISIANSGANAALGVAVIDALPASVNLVSAVASQGVCTGTATVSCSLGTLNGFGNATVTIIVSPTTEGVVGNTMQVTTGSFDPDLSNNSVTKTTTVGPPATGIQALIDAALPGTTIVVPPGLYAGGVDFKGKDITLESSAGPAGTVIHGNGGAGVKMGPGGTIRGFTITGSVAFFGAAIEVSGTGAVIKENIFDGNLALSGGYGAAIGGNNASAAIERNIFRNNECDSQFNAGVITFVNGSSPTIVNNVFANNPCQAVNLALPAGFTPVVSNNTFIGNRAAVVVLRIVSQVTQTYRNNVIHQNGIGFQAQFNTDAENPVWTNNLVFGNTTDYQGTASQTGVNGNISADPLFVNAAGGNYHLQAASPAIDAGSSLNAPTVDFDGAARPRDGNGDGSALTDIGAFERQ
ncbi:MAG TPA: choice-of-anchor Q domain-containing protein, partial [Burkholderiales bacterium]|nr:choice-of-anchor Q domain-containing protein [Burkholderiales bacterium]